MAGRSDRGRRRAGAKRVVSDGRRGVLDRLQERTGELGVGVYSFLLCLMTLAISGVVGLAIEQPYLFPSLGPTVMLFFESPKQPAASAKHAILGHLVGILVGAACLYGFGLGDDPAVTEQGLKLARVVAAALSVALTALLLRAIRSPHPPAGATTLLVSLGVLKSSTELVTMMLAVLLVTVVAVTFNRLLAVEHPLVPARARHRGTSREADGSGSSDVP